jgi:hypothetical protein
MRADAESGGNGLLAFAFVGEGLESAELVERMQSLALGVLGETVGFDKAFQTHDARDGRVFCEPLLLDKQLQGAKTAAAGLHAVSAGFFAGFVQDRADAQRLEKAAPFDVGGKLSIETPALIWHPSPSNLFLSFPSPEFGGGDLAPSGRRRLSVSRADHF